MTRVELIKAIENKGFRVIKMRNKPELSEGSRGSGLPARRLGEPKVARPAKDKQKDKGGFGYEEIHHLVQI